MSKHGFLLLSTTGCLAFSAQKKGEGICMLSVGIGGGNLAAARGPPGVRLTGPNGHPDSFL